MLPVKFDIGSHTTIQFFIFFIFFLIVIHSNYKAWSYKKKKRKKIKAYRKENVDIETLVISRNDDRKIRQSIRIMSRPNSQKRKWNQLSQF